MKTKTFSQLSKLESNYIVNVLEDFVRRKIIHLDGLREITEGGELSENEFEELTFYWIASLINYKECSEEILSGSKEKIIKFFLAETCNWDRGIDKYSKMAGSSLTDIINDKLRTRKKINVLDIGCGDAAFLKDLQKLYGQKVVCYGVSNVNNDRTDSIDFRLAIAEVLPEDWRDKFDLITCFEASMYFWDQTRAFNEALRALKPDGKLFYGTNNLKTYTNDVFLADKLNLHDFSFTYPEGHFRAGEKYTGVWGKYVSNFFSFFEYLKTLPNKNGEFRKYGKSFIMERKNVKAWCNETLQVKGSK